jgi:hypothetical protein
MDLSSFLANLASFANDIDIGRRGLASDGEEHTGRLSYEKGIAGVLFAFQEAQATTDPRALILTELAYLQQELQFCNESDKDTQSSLIPNTEYRIFPETPFIPPALLIKPGFAIRCVLPALT